MEYSTGYVDVKISTDRLNHNLSDVQRELDRAVLRDCEPFIPFDTGNLRQSGARGTAIGSGEIIWMEGYAHFMYQGLGMVGVKSRSAWAHQDEPKEYNGKVLNYHTAGTGAKWFETAKGKYLKSWIELIRRKLTKG